VQAERDAQPDVLLLDAGDALVGGGVLGDLSKGQAVLEGMGLMGYDAMALGPKELGLGEARLAELLSTAPFPILSANVTYAVDGRAVVPSHRWIEVAGHRVAVIGLTRPDPAVPAAFRVEDPRAALERVVPEVADDAGIVVILTNLDAEMAADYADMVPGIDLVVAALPLFAPKEVVETPTTGTKVVVAEQARPRHSGRRVGRLVARLTSDGSVEPESWETIAMDKTLADDPGMNDLLEANWVEFWGHVPGE
jgi:2',3'-cyclic-nucleotide 2'-phosphodiesterase (5'-nucleotidase family)